MNYLHMHWAWSANFKISSWAFCLRSPIYIFRHFHFSNCVFFDTVFHGISFWIVKILDLEEIVFISFNYFVNKPCEISLSGVISLKKICIFVIQNTNYVWIWSIPRFSCFSFHLNDWILVDDFFIDFRYSLLVSRGDNGTFKIRKE